ncbi:uncharacterized protein ACIB01_018929 [Guaruba guarouba]
MAESEPPQGALLQVAALRGELQQRRGAWPVEGAWPAERAWPEKPRPSAEGVASAELLPQLQALSNEIRQLIQDWPRLQDIISQWWQQPAQWTPAPPPGNIPFSHWLKRWSRASLALGLPRPLPLAPPPSDEGGRGQSKPRP